LDTPDEGISVGGIPNCGDYIDGQKVPDVALRPVDGDGPNASCLDEAGEMQPSSVRNCDDGDIFIDAPHGYYFTSDGIWHADETGAWDGNHSVVWREAFDACYPPESSEQPEDDAETNAVQPAESTRPEAIDEPTSDSSLGDPAGVSAFGFTYWECDGGILYDFTEANGTWELEDADGGTLGTFTTVEHAAIACI